MEQVVKAMKYLKVLLFLSVMLPGLSLSAQDCAYLEIVGGDVNQSVLSLLLTPATYSQEKLNQDLQGAGRLENAEAVSRKMVLEMVTKAENPANPAAEKIGEMVADDSSSTLAPADLGRLMHVMGLNYTLKGEYSRAVKAFDDSEMASAIPASCFLIQYRIISQYLERYSPQPGQPIFEHFNGGFYNFSRDSLRWGDEQHDSIAYHRMVQALSHFIYFSQGESVYYEMMGDLLNRYDDPVLANWLGAVAYLRAGESQAGKALFEEKAIYALEAPVTSRNRFDNYQFTQLKKHFATDLASSQEAHAAYVQKAASGKAYELLTEQYGNPGKGVVWLSEKDDNNIASIIRKASSREAAKSGERGKFAGDVDLKTVKSDANFNYYAVFMVLFVIGAVIFLGLQVRRNRKNM